LDEFKEVVMFKLPDTKGKNDDTVGEATLQPKKERRKLYNIHTEQEEDGRWIAEISEVPGAIAYGNTKEEAIERAKAIADSTSAASDPHNLV
jgi:hypothetical protein